MIVTRPVATNYGSLERNSFTPQGQVELKPGTIIDAVVLSNSNKGLVNLRIGHSVLTASTSIALQQNTHLLLEVAQVHPHLLLRLIPSTAHPALAKPLRDAMFSILTRQSGLAPALGDLLNRAIVEGRYTELVSLRNLFNALDKALPDRNHMRQAQGVRQAMLYSGLFLEASLTRSAQKSKAYASRDIKACLLRLQHALEHHKRGSGLEKNLNNMPASHLNDSVVLPRKKGLPVAQQRVPLSHKYDGEKAGLYVPELLSRTKGAIARLGYLQVISAENFNNGEHMWQLEIPVKHNDAVEIVSMSIEKEQKGGPNENNDSWVIRLALDLPQLGPVQIRISYFKQGTSTCFWSDSTKVRSLIESQFDRLKSNLEQHGVRNLTLFCPADSPAEPLSTDSDASAIDLLV